ELETPLATFAALLHQEVTDDRGRFPPIQQAIEGSRDLIFGDAFYRPDHAGWNDEADVYRLTEWLSAIDPADWQADDLSETDREDEFAFAREWFPALVRMYRRAAERGWVIASEAV